MTNPSPTLHRTTWPGDHDVASWSRGRLAVIASRHPAAGSTVAVVDRQRVGQLDRTVDRRRRRPTNGGPTEARGSILLSTSAYEVWHVAWPVGTPIELSGTLDVQSFCVVEGALRLLDLADPDAPGRGTNRAPARC